MAADVTIGHMKARPSARLFFALWPDAAARASFAAWQPPLQELCGGKAMRVDTLHLMLLFLGEVGLHRLEALSLTAQEVRAEPFGLILDAARYWGHNHVVYAAPHTVPPQLPRLVQGLEHSLRKRRFAFDKRTYKPHLTLLRHAKWDDTPLPQPSGVTWQAREFTLAQSERTEEGAHYRVLATFPLC